MTSWAEPAGSVAVALEGSRADFAAALGAGDAATVAAAYTPDAMLVAPASEVFRGRSAIERFWRTGVETGIERVELVVQYVQQRDDVAFEVGRYVLHVVPDGGLPVLDVGRYLVIHRLDADGRWRRLAEMFSPDRAPTLDAARPVHTRA